MALIPKFLGAVDFGMEATAGTGVAAGGLGLAFTDANIDMASVMGEFEGIGSGLTSERIDIVGRDVTYGASGPVNLASIGYVCAHGYGGYTGTGSDPYTHTWIGADYSDTTWPNQLQAWSLLEDQGDMGEATSHLRRAIGCTASSLEISGSERTPLSWKVSGNGWSVDAGTDSVTASIPSTAPLIFGQGAFKLGIGVVAASGSAIYPTEMTFTVGHNSQTLRNMTTGATGFDTGAILSGRRDVTCSIKIPLESDDMYDHLMDSINGATDYVSFSGAWTVGSETFTITINKARITNSPFEGSDGGPDPYYLNLEMKAYDSDPSIVLVDTTASNSYHSVTP